MTVFKLPDLGEGLPDAEIVSWKVKEGDKITEGDVMVEMSTAKAVVEVPSPFTGTIVKLYGGTGDVIKTGAPLASFQLENEKEASAHQPSAPVKTGAVQTSASIPPASQRGHIFNLPDLGEGLQEAEIVAWKVQEGGPVSEGAPMVELSTAKAVVEVPAPFGGTVVKLYGQPGDIIKTHAPLIEIDVSAAIGVQAPRARRESALPIKGDTGTVVGSVVVGTEVTSEWQTGADGFRASPPVRALAKKLNVDLSSVKGTGAGGAITLTDVKIAAENIVTREVLPSHPPNATPAALATAKALNINISQLQPAQGRHAVTKSDVLDAARHQMGGHSLESQSTSSKGIKAAPKVRAMAHRLGIDLATLKPSGPVGNVALRDLPSAEESVPASTTYQRPQRTQSVSGLPEKVIGPRRVMAQMMSKASAEVCHTSIFDEVSIARWSSDADITVRLMRAVVAAAFAEPALNSWFDGEKLEKTNHRHVHLGVAVDSPRGLFVPVIKNADAVDGQHLRSELNRLRKAIEDGSIKTADMSGGTITLSNFGMIAGRFATPIVVPPEVAIVGIGGFFERLVKTSTHVDNQKFIPVSVTFDHRAVTGGEAARFLRALLNDLALAY